LEVVTDKRSGDAFSGPVEDFRVTEVSGPDPDKADPRSFGGFIARALDKGGLKAGVREAEKLLQNYDEREIRKAAEDMPSKVRTAVLKMVTSRQNG
jgi:hypothetical protein